MAELTTNATGDTWHEAASDAIAQAVELLGDAEVLRVDIEAVTTEYYCSPEPEVVGYRASVTSRPKGGGHV